MSSGVHAMETELVAGLIVADRFRLERELGKGGMGAVWAATHMVTHKLVALKFMHAKSAEMTARFVREAQTASAVRHPNVVDIHDVLPLPDGTPLMVMEMLSGEALADKLTREGRLSPSETAQIMGPVISAVSAAHAAGIVHRDLKPENIFLSQYAGRPTITPKVLDFGIAKLVAHNTGARNESSLTRTGSVLGTPYYMSPEQVFGEKDVDVRADIWALGVILYQCLCGERPFEGDNFGQLLKSITVGRYQSIESVAPWVPPQLVTAIGSMLRDRQSRLTDLSEVEHVLTSLLLTPSGTALPGPTMTPQSGVHAFAASGQPSARSQPGYSPQSSGGYPSAQASGGIAAQSSGGFPGPTLTAPSAMTPSPMVRSQTLQMTPNADPTVPTRSSFGIKLAIAAAALALAGAGLVVRAKVVSHPDTTAASFTTTATPGPSPSTAILPSLPIDNTLSKDAGIAASSPSASATTLPHPIGAPDSGVGHNSREHNASTGGLSTAVPF